MQVARGLEMLGELRERLGSALDRLRGETVVDREAVERLIKEVQRSLLVADVDVELVLDLSERIKEEALKEEIQPGITRKEHVVKTVYEELSKLMGRETPPLPLREGETNVLMLVGIQGSGKTTTCAKLGRHLTEEGRDVALVSTDTFRPGAQEQLEQLAEKAGCGYHDVDSDDAVEIAKTAVGDLEGEGVDVVILDTAGRHKEEKALIDEMERIQSEVQPDFVFLVIDGTIGQQAKHQAAAFGEATEIGGIIVTKLDGTAKGGGALSAAASTASDIYFVGNGERIEDIERYDPKGFTGRLLGMGDLEALLRKVRRLEDIEEMKERVDRVAKGKFTLVDLVEQMEAVKSMGSLQKLLDMIPGLPGKLPEGAVEEAEYKASLWSDIIKSMTDEEKIDPSVINSSRRKRISRGAGVEEEEVKNLLRQYSQAKKMMKSRQGKKLLDMMRGRSGGAGNPFK